ncbi:hypothetical protein PVAND_009176 [Polypedilum vanderplanki]|uniref:Uncharacterized protein n=1 Tax=Polypedilum vanderplanki TaxID=319348 RepID=A0A9J6CCP8_POLVA|nr:hypothetical protein PVAND_009176 [Polypedilum vanderplanki]
MSDRNNSRNTHIDDRQAQSERQMRDERAMRREMKRFEVSRLYPVVEKIDLTKSRSESSYGPNYRTH